MKLVKIFAGFAMFVSLSVLTQVGGVIFLISWITYPFINKKFAGSLQRIAIKFFVFSFLYFFIALIVVPFIAKSFGRVRLPLLETRHVKPGNILTFIMCRNYVRPELRDAIFSVGDKMNAIYPRVRINYLDSGFPFINGFPLPPHLSHNDGKKLDISFVYIDKSSGLHSKGIPSFIGYGICEEPKPGEENMPMICDRKGYWQYSLLPKSVSQANKLDYIFDPKAVATLVNLISEEGAIGKIFIEPHLKTRLRLTSSKIRFHGCQAVRHDDHIHLQLK